MIEFVSIPKERIGILKANKNYVEKLEKLSEIKIGLNDEVSIDCDDPLKILRVKEVIRAFGRGFDFEDSLNLLDESYYLETIEIKEFSGKSRNRMITLRGRIIGERGKTKESIEKYSDVKISIYGKTIGIIGEWSAIIIAKKAIEMLLLGSLHSTVYRYLERNRVK